MRGRGASEPCYDEPVPRSTFRFWFTIIAIPSFLVVGVLGYLAWRQAVPGVRAALDPVPRWIGVRTPLAVDLVASRGGVRSVATSLRQGSPKPVLPPHPSTPPPPTAPRLP